MNTMQLFSMKFIVVILVQATLVQANCTKCISKDCISHANRILRNLKPEVDPCEDFFSFACGGYFERFGKNDTRSVYDDTWHSLQILIKNLLENLKPEQGTASEKLKTVFDTCMKKNVSEMKAVSDAINFLNQAGIPNWPNVDSNFQFANLSETLGKLAAYGEFAFIKFKPSPYEEPVSSPNALPTLIILPGNYLLNSKIKQKEIQSYVLRILNYFNVDKRESETMWKNFKDIESIGMQLKNDESAGALGCRGTSRSAYVSIHCSGEIETNMSFLCHLWKSAVKFGNFSYYNSSDTVHISCRWNHFNYIHNIFSSLDSINHKSLADYLSLRFFINHLDDMNMYLHLTKRTPEDKGSAIREPISRWEYCVGLVVKSMHLALGYEYIRTILTQPLVENALDMIQDYSQSLQSVIQSQNWIEENVKLFLIKQVKETEIGFASTMETFKNRSLISNYYNKFIPTKESFLKNVLELGKMSVITKDKPHFNSFYSTSDPYTMDFGLSLFLTPTYSYGLPKIWNYAGLGSVIGHELSHNLKFYFDAVSLDDGTEGILNNKVKCYTQQYSQFVMEKTGKMVSSRETEEEILADNVGWELTEKVLEHFVDTIDSLYLPALEYSALQLVYISYAQDGCAVLSEEVEKEFYSTKPHNLYKLRLLSVLQNSRMFSETFNCSTTFMNPENKCVFFG